MKIKSIIIAVSIFTFFTPAFSWAGCSDARLTNNWYYEGPGNDKLQKANEKIIVNYIDLGRCHKWFKGCNMLYCKKSKRDIYNILVQAAQNKYRTYGNFVVEGYPNPIQLCTQGIRQRTEDFGLYVKDKNIDISSWGPRCVDFYR